MSGLIRRADLFNLLATVQTLAEAYAVIQGMPEVDTVSEGAYNQVKWERDIAVEQLKRLGYTLGEEVTPIVRCKDCRYFAGEGMYCAWNIIAQFDHFYCYHGERVADGQYE